MFDMSGLTGSSAYDRGGKQKVENSPAMSCLGDA